MSSSPKKVAASTRLESNEAVGGKCSDDDDKGISKSTKKRRRLNDDEEAEEPRPTKAEELDESNSAEQEEEREEILRRWNNKWQDKDRMAMIRLLRHKGGPVGMYHWNQHDMKIGVPTSPSHLLGCDYDILFVHGVPHLNTSPVDYTDPFPISRTVHGGILKFEVDSYAAEPGVNGYFSHIPKTKIDHGDNDLWQHIMQLNDCTMRKCKFNNIIPHYRGIPCSLIKADDDLLEIFVGDVTIQVLANSGKLSWTATESHVGDEDDWEGYTKFARKQIEQEYDMGTSAESSWMCRCQDGRNFPVNAITHIQSFCRRPLPPNQWSWEKGDLIITIKGSGSVTTWTTHYLARPQSDTVRQRLLDNLKFHPSPTSENVQD